MGLFDEMSRLTEHMLQAYDGRIAAITEIHNQTTQDLNEFQAARLAMRAQQRQDLNEFRETLRRDTQSHLRELKMAHAAMSSQQREHLRMQQEELQHRVATFRNEIRTDQSKARETWYQFSETMRQRRAG